MDTPGPRMGVNARLVEGLSKSSVRIEHLDDAGTGGFWTTIA